MDLINDKKPPIVLVMIGWFVIIVLPVAFFVFGWRDIDVLCRRPTAGALPECHISESFAMGLYFREVDAHNVTNIGYQTRSIRSGSARGGGSGGVVLTSTVVLTTANGDVSVSRVSSNVDSNAKRKLIMKMREFLNSPEVLTFHDKSKMHSLFGYLGFLGVLGLVSIFLYILYYYLRKAIG